MRRHPWPANEWLPEVRRRSPREEREPTNINYYQIQYMQQHGWRSRIVIIILTEVSGLCKIVGGARGSQRPSELSR